MGFGLKRLLYLTVGKVVLIGLMCISSCFEHQSRQLSF